MRTLHTWKGEARTLGLKQLAEELHRLEGRIEETPESHDVLQGLKSMIQDYESLLEDPLIAAHGQKHINLSAIASDLVYDAQVRLEKEGVRWGQIRLTDAVPHWTEESADQIRTLLLHAISNSIDHGFIRASPEFKSKTRAELEIVSEQDGAAIVLHVYDNGQGLQWSVIEALAKAKGLTASSKDELVAALFMDGLSTASELSLSSGRGVGLAAMKSLCDEHGGRIRLSDRGAGSGTHLEISIPYRIAA